MVRTPWPSLETLGGPVGGVIDHYRLLEVSVLAVLEHKSLLLN